MLDLAKLKKKYPITSTYKSKTLNNLSRRVAGAKGIKYVVVHYTGNGGPSNGTARNCCVYFNREHVGASADFFIDNSGIYRYNPDVKKYYSWHCGDGHGAYGITNANSIGIEVCLNADKPFTLRERVRLRRLVRALCADYGIPKGHVVRHYDASRKECPYYYAKRPREWAKLRKWLFK